MGSSTRSMMMAKLHLGLSIVTGILQVDQQPTSSMTMAKLHLGLSIGMGIFYKSTSSRPLPFLMSGLHLGPPPNMGI